MLRRWPLCCSRLLCAGAGRTNGTARTITSDAANRADAAYLLDGPGAGIGVNAEILDSYLAGEGVYTYDDAKDAIESLYRCYDELLELYGDIEDGRVDVDRPD